MNNTILVLLPFEAAECAALQKAAPNCTFYFRKDMPVSDAVCAEVTVIIGAPDSELIARCPALQWVQLGSAGADAYTKEGVLPIGTKLTNATGAYGLAISEYMLAGALMLLKKLHLYRDQQKDGCWNSLGLVRSIYGSRCLSVGMGDIGGEFAKRMHAMGASVTGIRRTVSPAPDYVEAIYPLEELDALLPEMDIVALSLPNSTETTKLINRDRLSKMKDDAILINVGRGTAVDTEALCDALESGAIGGVVLDVTDPEPLPADHRLWKMENVILTPHTSGGYHLHATYLKIAEICKENIRHFLAGEELINSVDFATGYRRNQYK